MGMNDMSVSPSCGSKWPSTKLVRMRPCLIGQAKWNVLYMEELDIMLCKRMVWTRSSKEHRKTYSEYTIVSWPNLQWLMILIWWSSRADNCKNRSNYDTSNRFGTDTLWGSLFKKKTRATQNFNMAAIFQDGRHGVSWIGICVLEMAVNGQRRLLWQQSVCFCMQNTQLML